MWNGNKNYYIYVIRPRSSGIKKKYVDGSFCTFFKVFKINFLFEYPCIQREKVWAVKAEAEAIWKIRGLSLWKFLSGFMNFMGESL